MTFQQRFFALRAWFLLAAVVFGFCAHAQEKPPEYRLGAGDGIRIVVFQNPDLTLETRVSESRTITYPLIGAITIGGLTLGAAEQVIAKALQSQGFIKQPNVNIMLLQNRGNQVSVLGQVNRPGRYPLENLSIRVSEMIAVAGGIAATGGDMAIVTGMRDGKAFRAEIDVAGIFVNSNLRDDFVVSGGDVIYVHRMPMFYIYGEVQRASSYRVERGMTVRQALAQGGGPTVRGTERRLRLNRRGADGRIEVLRPGLDDPVQADDVIYVNESIF
jgi:polysaccharide biosynthesis/export protein